MALVYKELTGRKWASRAWCVWDFGHGPSGLEALRCWIVKRLSIAIVAALTLVPPVFAEPRPDRANWLGGPIAPHLMAHDRDDRGLERFPFDGQNDINSGVSWALWTRLARQFTEESRQASHLESGLRLPGRLGADFYYSRFDPGAFNMTRRPEFFAFHATADVSTQDDVTLEYGFGLATLQADRTLAGPSMEFRGERRMGKPWTMYARYAPSFMVSDGRFYHHLSLGLGASWKRIGVDAGYKLFLNPLRNGYGPEAALRVWLRRRSARGRAAGGSILGWAWR